MGLLGINRRNRLIADVNDRTAIALADDKLACKQALQRAGIPVPETLLACETLSDLATADLAALPDEWVLKPNRGRKGLGIVVASGRNEEGWQVLGETWAEPRVRRHLRRILLGEFSLTGTHREAGYFEQRIVSHPAFDALGAEGLSDVRVICFESEPVMAMVRLPLACSGGRANLHRGAVGLAIDLEDGRAFRAYRHGDTIARNPDTGEDLLDFAVPQWLRVREVAARCARATGLSYLGADVVIDADEGVLVLECNAFPGLEIQNVNARGLRAPLEQIRAERGGRPAEAG